LWVATLDDDRESVRVKPVLFPELTNHGETENGNAGRLLRMPVGTIVLVRDTIVKVCRTPPEYIMILAAALGGFKETFPALDTDARP
jgi:hypothetical protein